jgi:hypothetical protein
MKKLGMGLAILLLIAVGGLIYLKTNLNGIVERALEKYGSAATQTDVDISSVSISLATGRGEVSGLSIGNPKSYIAAKALKVGDIDMILDTRSVTRAGPIIIKELTIDKPYVVYEVAADGNTNLSDLQKNLSKGKKPENAKPTRKVIIRDLYIKNGTVSVTHALLKGEEVKTDLPLIHLRNVGKEGEGATPQEIARQVIAPIAAKAAQAGSQVLTRELKGLNKDDLKKKAGDALNNLLNR